MPKLNFIYFNKKNCSNNVKSNEEDLDDYMDDDLDDDDDIDDDIDDDDDDDDSDSSSSSQSASPDSLSSLLTSGTSSGYSTPTKSSKSKHDLGDSSKTISNRSLNSNGLVNMNPSDSSFDLSALNEKLNKKQSKKQHMMTCSSSSLSSSSSSMMVSSSSSSSSSSSTTTSKRTSRLGSMGCSVDNPAEKRAFHILSERQRRNDLKKLFETLRTNIPTLCDKQKASKLTILKAAVDHLVDVSNKKEKLSTVFEKEKQKHTQLMQHLKSLQQQMPHQINFNFQSVSTTPQSAMAVH